MKKSILLALLIVLFFLLIFPPNFFPTDLRRINAQLVYDYMRCREIRNYEYFYLYKLNQSTDRLLEQLKQLKNMKTPGIPI